MLNPALARSPPFTITKPGTRNRRVRACGGGGGDGDSSDVASGGDDDKVTTTTAAEPEVDIPAFPGDFDRVCTTQVGLKGVTVYEEARSPPRPSGRATAQST